MQETAVRFAICDDDKTYAEKMKALILQTFQLPQPVECVIYLNQEQILKYYREDKIDIVFMDIEFGDVIGFQVARRLSMQDSQLTVVYMTNYEHYITEAFVCRPLGFIRKKPCRGRFANCRAGNPAVHRTEIQPVCVWRRDGSSGSSAV